MAMHHRWVDSRLRRIVAIHRVRDARLRHDLHLVIAQEEIRLREEMDHQEEISAKAANRVRALRLIAPLAHHADSEKICQSSVRRDRRVMANVQLEPAQQANALHANAHRDRSLSVQVAARR